MRCPTTGHPPWARPGASGKPPEPRNPCAVGSSPGQAAEQRKRDLTSPVAAFQKRKQCPRCGVRSEAVTEPSGVRGHDASLRRRGSDAFIAATAPRARSAGQPESSSCPPCWPSWGGSERVTAAEFSRTFFPTWKVGLDPGLTPLGVGERTPSPRGSKAVTWAGGFRRRGRPAPQGAAVRPQSRVRRAAREGLGPRQDPGGGDCDRDSVS